MRPMQRYMLVANTVKNIINAHQPAKATSQLFVDGVCGMCKTRIETTALKVKGVEEADWNIEERMLTVAINNDKYDEDLLCRAIANIGHDNGKYEASDEAYAKLHGCCKYRDAAVVADHQPNLFRPARLSGRVLVEENGQAKPLQGVNIYWLNETVVVESDKNGQFTIERPSSADWLIASYIGYYSDTIALTNETTIELTLSAGATLDAVEVRYQRKSIEVSFIEPILTQQIGRKELLKAACCTLAESFETNPAIDVSFTDAVTGARQIEMLGLAGPYVQILRENTPDVRGLAAIYGLEYIPGPWIEGIQLAKGPGSVINGYESITGQINVELKKPEEGERFYLNLYGNQGSRMEGNANARVKLGKNWHTGFLIHGNLQNTENDRNGDGFLDLPTGKEWSLVNRWKYSGENGWNSQFGVKLTKADKTSGQVSFEDNQGNSDRWLAQIQTNRMEGWAKAGKVFPNRPETSIGLILSGSIYNQDALFEDIRYDADQKSFNANLIYREIIGSTTHRINSGISLQVDQFEEKISESIFNRRETIPGTFLEYTYQPNDNFTAVAGLRGDHHNQFGFFLSPRLHFRYAPGEKSVFRLSAGQGRRTASIFAENIGVFASSRSIEIDNNSSDKPYGLNQEIAWNIGVNWRKTFILKDRELILTLDAYHTNFEQQVVVDYDHNPRLLRFYNLDGKSFSNTFQSQLDYALLRNLDLRIAYRFNDVQTDYEQGRLERPFVSRHRAFANLAYATNSGWDFDCTVNWQGAKRIPSTAENPVAYQLLDRSPNFVVVNVQVSKQWQEHFDAYIGIENLFNFVQENPIIAAEDPFGTFFDSNLVWGPIFGRMVYAGIRYTIPW